MLLARAAGVDWAAAQGLTDAELESRLYRPAVPRSSHHLEPDYIWVHQELKQSLDLAMAKDRTSSRFL